MSTIIFNRAYQNEKIDKKIKITEEFIDYVIGITNVRFAHNNKKYQRNISVTQDLIKDIKESLKPKGGLYNRIEESILIHLYRQSSEISYNILKVILSYVDNKYYSLTRDKIIEKNNKFKENIEKQNINKKGLGTLIKEQNNNINQNINKNNDIKNYEIKVDNNLLFSFNNEIKDENKIKPENIDVKNLYLSKNNPLGKGINKYFQDQNEINNIIISDDERNELEQEFKNEIDHQDNDTDSVNEELNVSFDGANTEMLKNIEYVNNYFIKKNEKIDKNEYFQNQNKINNIITNDNKKTELEKLEQLFKADYLTKKEFDERKKAIENKQQNKINEIQNDKKDISNYNQKQEINIRQNRLLDAGRDIIKNFQDPFNSKHIRENNNIGFKK